jgi:dsRNA-specific ribonuclease
MKAIMKSFIIVGILALVGAFMNVSGSKKAHKEVVIVTTQDYPNFNHTNIQIEPEKKVKRLEQMEQLELIQVENMIDYSKFSEVNIEDVINEEIQYPETN